MDIQQPTTLAESRKAPTRIGSGGWLGGYAVFVQGHTQRPICRPEYEYWMRHAYPPMSAIVCVPDEWKTTIYTPKPWTIWRKLKWLMGWDIDWDMILLAT